MGNEFRMAIDYINCHIDDRHKILYCALDYSHISKVASFCLLYLFCLHCTHFIHFCPFFKHRNLNVSSSLNDVATWSVNQTGFFCSRPQWKIKEGGSIEPFDSEEENENVSGVDKDAATALEKERLKKRLSGILFFPMVSVFVKVCSFCVPCSSCYLMSS